MNFTYDETMLMAIYNPGTRLGLISALTDMRGYLDADETELRELTDTVIDKLKHMIDADFDALDLIPDFDETEDNDAG